MTKLIDGKINKLYSIFGISQNAPHKIKRRILELGFTRGQKIKIIRKSLLGKAYLIELRGFILTIRKDIANFIEIE